jgi:hypothetical protein
MQRAMIDNSIYKRLPDDLKLLTEPFEGRARDMVLLSSITVLSCAFPNVAGYYDGKMVFPHINTILLAPPAKKKRKMMYAKELIKPIHQKIYNDSKKKYDECAVKLKPKEPNNCPPVQVKIMPANTSSAELYSFLNASNHGLIIMESEVDTLAKMFANDWGDFNDVLRKVFHNDDISKARTGDKSYFEKESPKLTILLSGTPAQLYNLIRSRENGLFSRLMIYSFDEVSLVFDDVFAPRLNDIEPLFQEAGKKIFDLYNTLVTLKTSIKFDFSEPQKKKFLKIFGTIKRDIVENYSQEFVSSVHRGALVAFRIAMILTILRNAEEVDKDTKELICCDYDFMVAINLTKTLLRHIQYVFESLGGSGIPAQDVEMLSKLSEYFTTQQALEVGKQLEIPTRTVHDKLAQWKEKKIIRSIKKGNYQQL